MVAQWWRSWLLSCHPGFEFGVSPAHSWLPIPTWDGIWLRADLCEGRQRRKLWEWTAGSPKTYKEKKKSKGHFWLFSPINNVSQSLDDSPNEPRMTEPRKTQPRMDWTWNGPHPNGLNPEWTALRMDWTQNGLNSEWTEIRMDSTQNGLNSEWTQPRIDSSRNGLNPDWDSTPNGLNPEWDSTPNRLNPDWDSIPNGLNS
jgi:hypothetical protein